MVKSQGEAQGPGQGGAAWPVIRTGLLHVPQLDTDAGSAVRSVLRTVRGVVVMQESYAASQPHWIEETLRRWCDEEELDLVLTIGGTLPAPGPSQLEIVPEATSAILDRAMPGLSAAMRSSGQEIFELAIMDRGVSGIRGRTLILNLPAGAEPASLFLEGVILHIPYVLAHLRQDAAKMITFAEYLDADMTLDADDAPDGERLRIPSAGAPDERAQDERNADEGRDETGGEADGEASAETDEAASHKGLNAADFAAFLQRRKRDSSDES